MKKLILKILGMNICGLCGGLFRPPPAWAIGKKAFYICEGRYCVQCADEAMKYEEELKQREHDLNWAKRNPEKLRALVKEEEAKEVVGGQISQEQMQKAFVGSGLSDFIGLSNVFGLNHPLGRP